jgi:hypothetical protein
MATTLYGHAVDSELPLPRAREGAGPRGRLAIRRAVGGGGAPRGEGTGGDRPGKPRGEDTGAPPDGAAVLLDGRFAVHRREGRLIVWCAASGTFVVDVAAGTIDTDPGPAGAEQWEHRLACVVVPLLLAERGDLALHASAVATGAGAVVFCGQSGRGKSTTAWALGERGFPVLAEDGCVIETAGDGAPLVWPGLAGVRLRDATGARPLSAAGGTSPAAVPLAAVVILGERAGAAPAADPVAPTDAVTALMPHGVHALGPSQAAVFRGTAAVARAVPVFHATLPDDLAGAGAHAEALISALRLG